MRCGRRQDPRIRQFRELRVRGERWVMTERLAPDGAAIFRRYDELFDKGLARELNQTAEIQRDRQL